MVALEQAAIAQQRRNQVCVSVHLRRVITDLAMEIGRGRLNGGVSPAKLDRLATLVSRYDKNNRPEKPQ